MLLALVLIAMTAFGVYLDRRMRRLERLLAGFAEGDVGVSLDQWAELPEAEPEAPAWEAETAEPDAEQPIARPNILLAEPRPDDLAAANFEPDEPSDAKAEGGFRPSFGFEELFGRKLPIWAGGITLAIAGMLIVKLSIEAGLLSPVVRVIGGMIFGAFLIGAAELALRNEDRVRDSRVRQALAGAGVASLYASILIAHNLYGLIPPLIAMLGAAAVTALAMGLAIRFGAPSALLGLAGGLAAPALIGSTEPNVPLLSLYLALAVGGLAALSRSQRWAWLGISALVGGFGWGLVLLLTGALDVPGSISLGLYILLLGIALPTLGLAGTRSNQLQLIAGILASAQMAALVASGGFSLLNWGLFAAIAVAAVWLAQREPGLERLPPVGLTIALLLLGAWPDPGIRDFAIVLVGTAIIFGLAPLRRLWGERGELLDAAQIAALALGGWLIPMLHFYGGVADNDTPLGLLAAGLSVAAGGIAASGWTSPTRRGDARFAMLAVTAAFLAASAASLLLPLWFVGIAIAMAGLALLHLGQQANDPRLEPFAWIFAVAGLAAFFQPDASFGNSTAIDTARFSIITALAALFAWRGGYRAGRNIAQFLAPLLLYGALAPLLDTRVEPLIAPVTLLVLAWAWNRGWAERLVPAMASAGLIVLLWAAWPLAEWSTAAVASLAAEPMLLPDIPDASTAIRQLLLPGLLAALAIHVAKTHLTSRQQQIGLIAAAVLAAVAVHSLFKQLLAIDTAAEFVARGLAERTTWEILLLAAGALALRFGQRRAALALAGAGAAHFALYTMLLHNPLWSPQDVGPLPLLNLLLPAYALGLAMTWAASRFDLARSVEARRAVSGAQMLLIILFAFSTLRQLFHGSLLTEPGLSQAEDIGRSIVAIALAIGFLTWGIARQDRDWRLASLALMLAAVGKVFLFDASGLEGLTRIASFIALGFSLIGIGWLYARHLPPSAKAASAG